MSSNKFFLLYSDEKQSKLLSTAVDLDMVKSESEYYTKGTWFEYDLKENSNVLHNEKVVKAIAFPESPKQRHFTHEDSGKVEFKWLK